MALVLSKETPSGATAEYWKIINIDFSNISSYYNDDRVVYRCNFLIAGFLNENARRNGKNQLDTLSYMMNENITVGPSIDLRPTIYTYLKTLPEWQGAVDDLDSPQG